jgi:hypothetical protein
LFKNSKEFTIGLYKGKKMIEKEESRIFVGYDELMTDFEEVEEFIYRGKDGLKYALIRKSETDIFELELVECL